jgi:hypothetical protein
MNSHNINKPILTESGVKYYLNEMLKQCHQFKIKYYNIMLNLGLFFLFFVILFFVLFFKYKGTPSLEEKQKKDHEKQHYIISKIKNYQNAKKRAQQDLITGLPEWRNDYDNIYFMGL